MCDYEKIRSYNEGYRHGQSGEYDIGWDFIDDLLPPGFETGPTVDVEAYNAGWEHGRRSVTSGK